MSDRLCRALRTLLGLATWWRKMPRVSGVSPIALPFRLQGEVTTFLATNGTLGLNIATWNLPATLSVMQSGTIGLRQYVVNGGGYTISVSGLPTGVTYNSGLERLEGAATGTSSGTATFTLSRVGGSDVVATATVSLYEPGSYPAGYYPSYHDLELVMPRAAGTSPDGASRPIPSTHRIFKAYPGIPYNIPAYVIGGAYPYTFSLSNAPAGMTINAQTGEVSWPNPQATATPTITVTDMNGVQRSSAWTITVTTEGFYFVDAVSGNDSTNDGTLAAPWRTISKLFSTATGNGAIVYFRQGTYDLVGCPIGSRTTSPFHHVAVPSTLAGNWIAYPGETPTLDYHDSDRLTSGLTLSSDVNQITPQIRWESASARWLEGWVFTNHNHMGHYIASTVDYGVYWRLNCTNFGQRSTTYSGHNPACISWGAWSPRHYAYYADNTGSNNRSVFANVGLVKLYRVNKMLVERIYLPDDTAGFGDWKASMPRATMRANTFLACDKGFMGNMAIYAGGLEDERFSAEVCYNFFRQAPAFRDTDAGENGAIEIGTDSDATWNWHFNDIRVYRNTLVGNIWIATVQTAGELIDMNSNVVMTNRTGGYPIDWTASFLNEIPPGEVIDSNNLVDNLTSGLVNDDGQLVGANRTSYLNLRGHEIAES